MSASAVSMPTVPPPVRCPAPRLLRLLLAFFRAIRRRPG